METDGLKILKQIIAKDDNLCYENVVIKALSKNKSNHYLKRVDKMKNPLEHIDEKQLTINPNASAQMRLLWKNLGLESDVLTPKKEESFSTPVLKELVKTTSDKGTKEIIQQVLDISSTKNLLSQYIPAYETNTIGGYVWQSVRYPGTLSYRLSGKADSKGTGISMVTQPTITKKAIVAPKGWIITASDFAGLETNIAANITHDPTKIKVLADGYDSHCLHASYYFTDKLEELMGEPFKDTLEFNLKFNLLRKSNKELYALRDASKPCSFLLEYGGYPKKLSKGIKSSVATAQAIFDRFHNDLYPETTNYKLNYVLPTAQNKGYIHLGLGARLYSKNPSKDLRSITNATYQFWSILTLIAIVKIRKKIKNAGYEKDILIYSTIHDEISAMVREDATIIKWYNDNLIDIMIQPFLIDQEVPLQSNLDIGLNRGTMIELPNNCSVDYIQEIINKLKGEQ